MAMEIIGQPSTDHVPIDVQGFLPKSRHSAGFKKPASGSWLPHRNSQPVLQSIRFLWDLQVVYPLFDG